MVYIFQFFLLILTFFLVIVVFLLMFMKFPLTIEVIETSLFFFLFGRKTSNELKMISLTISSCIVVTKLGAQRISCPAFYTSLAETIQELFESARGLGSLGISYQFATMAGHEHEFLNIFGPKVLHHNTEDEILFWMTLLQKKLFAAFVKETFLHQLEGSFDNQVNYYNKTCLGSQFTEYL